MFINDSDKLKKLKRKYIRLEIEFLIMFFIFLWFLYSNYNYIVFKTLISHNYIFTDALDNIYKQELKTDSYSYSKDFDNIAVSLITKRIQKENKDVYTMLFLKGSYKAYKKEMKTEGKETHIEKINNDTVMLTLTNFSSPCRKEFIKNADEMKNYKNIIIDLRNNGGGMLRDAYKISDYFLAKDSIIYTQETRIKLFTRTWKAKKDKILDFDNIFILQNENTASSAEVFINALKDNLGNVTIIGKTSYGKGIGQAELYLKDGYAVKATVLRLITPKGFCIDKTGIEPDIKDYNMYQY